MVLFQLGQPLVPYSPAVVMPLPPVIHRLSPIEQVSAIGQNRILINKNGYPQIVTIHESKVNKIRLTNDQIQQFTSNLTDNQIDQFTKLAWQINSGSITMENAILQIRGGTNGDGLADVIAVIAFIIFVNRYDSFFGVQAFKHYPLPFQDPIGWMTGK